MIFQSHFEVLFLTVLLKMKYCLKDINFLKDKGGLVIIHREAWRWGGRVVQKKEAFFLLLRKKLSFLQQKFEQNLVKPWKVITEINQVDNNINDEQLPDSTAPFDFNVNNLQFNSAQHHVRTSDTSK